MFARRPVLQQPLQSIAVHSQDVPAQEIASQSDDPSSDRDLLLQAIWLVDASVFEQAIAIQAYNFTLADQAAGIRLLQKSLQDFVMRYKEAVAAVKSLERNLLG